MYVYFSRPARSCTESRETMFAQLLFHVTVYDNGIFRRNDSFNFYETDFMELVSSVYVPNVFFMHSCLSNSFYSWVTLVVGAPL
jgi:hypothetical protein